MFPLFVGHKIKFIKLDLVMDEVLPQEDILFTYFWDSQ